MFEGMACSVLLDWGNAKGCRKILHPLNGKLGEGKNVKDFTIY